MFRCCDQQDWYIWFSRESRAKASAAACKCIDPAQQPRYCESRTLAMSPYKRTAAIWGLLTTTILAGLIVLGSRNLNHFDAALVGYTFATLFAMFGITYRYAMWLQRPPTRMYWKRGWSVFLTPRLLGSHLLEAVRRFFLAFAANLFIFRRGRL